MAWVRIHDAALSHPKIVGLFRAADPFHLWVWGLSYCQQHLTDGVIPIDAIPKGTAKAVERLLAKGLWELHPSGYLIHDYLDWNTSRAYVVKKRAEIKGRVRKHRNGSDSVTQNVTRYTHTQDTRYLGLDVLGLDRTSERESEGKPTQTLKDSRVSSTQHATNLKEHWSNSQSTTTSEPDIGEIAARFCDTFVKLYAAHRNGAHYHLKPSLDWSRICELLGTYDEAHLRKLAVILLDSDDEWIAKTDRGIGVLVAKVSWCEDRLKQWEQEHGVSA